MISTRAILVIENTKVTFQLLQRMALRYQNQCFHAQRTQSQIEVAHLCSVLIAVDINNGIPLKATVITEFIFTLENFICETFL